MPYTALTSTPASQPTRYVFGLSPNMFSDVTQAVSQGLYALQQIGFERPYHQEGKLSEAQFPHAACTVVTWQLVLACSPLSKL